MPYINHFIQPDTIIPDLSNPQSWNRYSYVVNNPVKHTDPTGHTYACEDSCGRIGTFEHVFALFKDSPFAYYYANLSNAERSIHAYKANPTDSNRIIMDADIGLARLYKEIGMKGVPQDKLNKYMKIYPDILGGGEIGTETDFTGLSEGGGGSAADPNVTPMLPYVPNPTLTPTISPTPTRRPTPTMTSTPTPLPTKPYQSTPIIPRKYGGELIN